MADASYTLSEQAKREIVSSLQWSERHFGAKAAIRYKELLKVAFLEIANNANLLGAREIEGFSLYHLKHCRKKAPVDGLIVKSPRHFVLYRVNNETVEILRILHDQMDIETILRY